MEDAERRRERLNAMRAAAAQPEASGETGAMPGGLYNPLLEAPQDVSSQRESFSTPRFDFYTDPMAAFSDNKRRGTGGNLVGHAYLTPPGSGGSPMPRFSSPRSGPWNTDTTSPAAYQIQSNYSPNPGVYQSQGPYPTAPPYGSSRAIASPSPMHQGTPPQVGTAFGGAGSYISTIPHRGMSSTYPRHQGNPNFGLVSPSSNYGHSRGQSFDSSPRFDSGHGSRYNPSSGRGRGQRDGGNKGPAFGWSGGSGQRFYSPGTAMDQSLGPEKFYHKSMLEDPWQHLEAVVWKGIDAPVNHSSTPGSSSSWLPKSISMKKPRVSEAPIKSSPGQSLAEYLAASFNEAKKDDTSQ